MSNFWNWIAWPKTTKVIAYPFNASIRVFREITGAFVGIVDEPLDGIESIRQSAR